MLVDRYSPVALFAFVPKLLCDFEPVLRDLVRDDACVSSLFEPLLAILATMLAQLARLTKQVPDIVRGEEVCRRLMSVPEGGPITALAFQAVQGRGRAAGPDPGALPVWPDRHKAGSADAVTNWPARLSTKPPTRSWCAVANGRACALGE